jgi:hypothetical protein
MRTSIAVLLLLAAAFGCSKRDTGDTTKTGNVNQPTAMHDSEGPCWLGDGKHTPREFVGSPECMRQLPQRRMRGVWVRAFEYSVFFEGATRVPPGDFEPTETHTWFDTYPDDAMDRFGFKFDGKAHAFLIDFIGTKSKAPGLYGHFGAYPHGALATHILSVREIPLPGAH